jgi:hypothetical protein
LCLSKHLAHLLSSETIYMILLLLLLVDWFVFFRQGFAIQPRLALKSQSSCFRLPNAEIIGVYYHPWLQPVNSVGTRKGLS